VEESCVQSRRTRIKTGSKCTWMHPSRVRSSHYTALSFRRKNKNIPALTWTLQDETNLKHRNVISLLNKAADSREESLMTLFSLSHSAVLAQLSAECLRGMENAQPNIKARHSGPVTQKSLALLASVIYDYPIYYIKC
jgi:hypothetical protein